MTCKRQDKIKSNFVNLIVCKDKLFEFEIITTLIINKMGHDLIVHGCFKIYRKWVNLFTFGKLRIRLEKYIDNNYDNNNDNNNDMYRLILIIIIRIRLTPSFRGNRIKILFSNLWYMHSYPTTFLLIIITTTKE